MRSNGWDILGGKHAALIKQNAALMADIVTGAQDSTASNFLANPLFGDREDLAYLQGSRAIKSLRLGPFGVRQVNRQFKLALSNRGLSNIDADIEVAQFQVYYWTMTICLTSGRHREIARKKVEKSRSVVEQLRSQTGRHPALSP